MNPLKENYSDNKGINNSLHFLIKITEIISGVLKHRNELPWKNKLNDNIINDLVGDSLVSYIIGCIDMKQLFVQTELHDLIRPLLENYFPITDLDFIISDQGNMQSEILNTRSELNEYIMIAGILDYPIELIQKIESIRLNAPESLHEAEHMQKIMNFARDKTLEILNKFC